MEFYEDYIKDWRGMNLMVITNDVVNGESVSSNSLAIAADTRTWPSHSIKAVDASQEVGRHRGIYGYPLMKGGKTEPNFAKAYKRLIDWYGNRESKSVGAEFILLDYDPEGTIDNPMRLEPHDIIVEYLLRSALRGNIVHRCKPSEFMSSYYPAVCKYMMEKDEWEQCKVYEP